MTPGHVLGGRWQWHADGMILACHTLIYSDDADATRAFFRDVLGFPNVDAGTGDHNWLIFGTGPSELGVHPTGPLRDGSSSTSRAIRRRTGSDSVMRAPNPL